jgi:hypothetical protein
MSGSGEDDKMGKGDELKEKSKAYNFNPDDVAPPEVQQQLWELLKWRDEIFREVLRRMEMIPGLTDLIDALTDALNACGYYKHNALPYILMNHSVDVYTLLAPYISVSMTAYLTKGHS